MGVGLALFDWMHCHWNPADGHQDLCRTLPPARFDARVSYKTIRSGLGLIDL
jgi:hypothetical protein